MSFLQNYAHYCESDEAPPIFHLWSALSVLSNVSSRRVWTQRGRFFHYTNMYLLLVGPPGDGKSSAMSVAKKMVQELEFVVTTGTPATTQAIMQLMSLKDGDKKPMQKTFTYDGRVKQYTPLAVFATEFANFISPNPLGWIDFLTAIWDEEVFKNETKGKGVDIIPGPFISLLGCLTDSVTSGFIKQNIISGGFARRAIFITSPGRGKPNPWSEESPSQVKARQDCLEWCRSLMNVSGQFSWAKKAHGFFDSWYRELRSKTPDDPITAGYINSKPDLLIKIAMLISLSQSHELVLQEPYLQLALELLDKTEPSLNKIFGAIGRNELAPIRQAVVSFLSAQNGPITKKRLRGFLFKEIRSEAEFFTLYQNLIDEKLMVQAELTLDGQKVVVVATPEIMTRSINSTQTKTDSETLVVELPSAHPVQTPEDGSASAGQH